MMENGVENIDRPSKEETKAVVVHGENSQLNASENVFQVLLEEEAAEGDDVSENNGDRSLSEAETKTADGAISQLSLVDNVVQVFVEEKDSEGGDEVLEEDVGTTPPRTEAKTADGGISQLSLVDNVVQVFHERKPSEGDEVFEEAIDSNPEDILTQEHHQKSDLDEPSVNGDGSFEKFEDSNSLEVNGSTTGSQHTEKFEEATEIDLPSDDPSSEVEEPVVFEEKVEPPVAREPEEQRVVNRVDNDYSYLKAVLREQQNDTVDANVEEHVKEAASVNEDLDAKPLVDVEEEVKEVSSMAEDEKNQSLVGDDEHVKEVSSTIEDGETKPLSDVKDCDVIIEDKSENGDRDNVKLEEKPLVYTNSSADFQVSMNDNGNEISEQMLHQDESSGKVEDTEASVKTSIMEEIDTPEVKNVTSDSVASDTEALEIKEVMGNQLARAAQDSPTEIDGVIDSEGESEAEDCHPRIDHVYETNEEEGRDNQAKVEKPQEFLTGNIQEKDVSVVKELGESSMENGEARISVIKESVDSSVVNETSVQPAAADPNPTPHPAGLGRAAPFLEPARAPQQSRVNGAVPQRQTQLVEDPMNGEAEENDETREKLQMIRVKFLRLAHRLGQTPHNVVVAQVLYRLGLAEQLRGRNASRVGAFSFDRASAMAEQLEAAGQEPLDFSCTIMVLGKSGVGKSATINSIFDEVKFGTDAFQVSTKKVQDVVGTVQGIKVRIIDTPGLLPCWSDQRKNEKILQSVKQFIKKNPPDIVLYLDRLDMQTRDFGDMPVLRTITEIFGPSIWFNAIVVLTHAASAPPDGPNGIASSYEMFITQRSHAVQQAIRQAAGDMRLMNPVSLVENHSACRTNRAGQRVLPNGQVWKPHLLLLSFASKILAEANTLLKLQDNPPGKAVATRSRAPPLPYLLSSLLQSRAQVKLPEEQAGDEDDLDDDLDESSDSDDESEYDELPPFKPLTKAQLASLSKAQKKAYFDEVEYRENLFMKKQLKEEKRRRKLLKKMRASAKDIPNDYNENAEEDGGGPANVPTAMPDFALPSSFDADNPSHRYRFLDSGNQWLIRPVLETHGWDHDVGYEGINVERLFAIKEKIPLSFSGQVTKDKKECNLQMEVTSSIKHGEGKGTSLGFDMQTMGKDVSYTIRSDTRFINYRHNKTAAGLAVTLLGDTLTAGLKLEDQLLVNKRFKVVMTGGAMTGRGDVAYGGSLEATLRDKDFPLGRSLSTLGLSIMDWHGDLAIGCNIQSQIPVGRSTNLIARANLNNRGSGQLSIRLNSSEHLQLAMVGLLPLLRKIHSLYQQRVNGE